MDRMLSLEFLRNCLDYVNNMSDMELKKSKSIFEEELLVSEDFENDFEMFFPLEADMLFNYDGATGDESNKKVSIDYKLSEYKELSADEFECMAA